MNRNSIPKYTFILGALVDAGIGLSWALIAAGMKIPIVLNGYQGTGTDYQFAMYISAMFMFGWAVILAWGAVKPLERKGLLLITAVFLALSILLEVTLYGDLLSGAWFIFGVTKRALIILLFIYVYIKLKDESETGKGIK